MVGFRLTGPGAAHAGPQGIHAAWPSWVPRILMRYTPASEEGSCRWVLASKALRGGSFAGVRPEPTRRHS